MNIDSLNLDFYNQPDTVEEYISQNQLWAEEKLIFSQYASFIRAKAVLDLGCGGGRTTPALSEMAADYTGLDYSLPLIEGCKTKFQSETFVHGDASAMDMFGDAQFDFVLFSFNGIDCMSQDKRIKTLHEVHRVLKPGGVFAFSSHNRDDNRRVVVFDKRVRNPINHLRNFRSYWKVRQHQVREKTYEILSDPLAGFGHLTYYINASDQVQQLEDAGFKDTAILNQAVQFIEVDTPDCKSHFLHYICKKGL